MASSNQARYPACPVNHDPLYFCCEYDDGATKVKELVIRYQRPTGPDLDDAFIAGWRLPRQVNFPHARFSPDTPAFQYDDPSSVCRLQRVVTSAGLRSQLQCAHDNASIAENSQDANVYWTSTRNERNNNVSFVIGATCMRLSRSDGSVDAQAKAACRSAPPTPVVRFASFTATPLLVIYGFYFAFLVVLGVWWLRRRMAVAALRRPRLDIFTGLEPGKHDRGSIASKLLVEPTTPMLCQATDDALISSTRDIKQHGVSDSIFGRVVWWWFLICTTGLALVMATLLMDRNSFFSPPLFDPSQDVMVAFVAVWGALFAWLSVITVTHKRLADFFRLPKPLSRAAYVHMFKPETSRVVVHDHSFTGRLWAKIEQWMVMTARPGYGETVRVYRSAEGVAMLEFQHLRYLYCDEERRFVPGSVALPESFATIHEEGRKGLNEDQITPRLQLLGQNYIKLVAPSLWSLVSAEILRFFYIYQVLCYAVWLLYGHVVAFLNLAIVVVSATVNIRSKRKLVASVLETRQPTVGVGVMRDGMWQTIKHIDLVPGDLVRVDEGAAVPCDLVLIQGSAVCDESMLTGESIPVLKFPLPTTNPNPETSLLDPNNNKHMLFAGTKTMPSGRDEEVLAVVHRTGAHTARGRVIQSLLYPVTIRFKHFEQLKLLIVLLGIYGVVAALFAMHLLATRSGLLNTVYSFVFGVFMLSAVLSPLLPVVITIGQVNATRRLGERDIYCLNGDRIALTGKVRVLCLDKTGTLTKQGLDFHGIQAIRDGCFTSDTASAPGPNDTLLSFALATCHALGSVDGDLVGNQVELKMFQTTNWTLIEEETKPGQPNRLLARSHDGRNELEVLKRFEFDHHLMTMSVLVRHKVSGRSYIFTKGSFENVEAMCRARTVPLDYSERASAMAKNGCYVLGLAFREVTAASPPALNRMMKDREAVERDLSMLGLLIFENELQEDATDVISQLRAGSIRSVMVTGDHPMTACHVARKCGMISPDIPLLLGDIVAQGENGTKMMLWKNIDTNETLSMRELLPVIEQCDNGSLDVELAVTERAFDFLLKMEEIHKLLFHIRIFSRMTPVSKVECVQLHMAAGAVTGMCGDGGNDCGALRAAHVGVALSESEASVVSPFTSKTKSLTAVLDVCCEGRATLATSSASIKFLVMYGLIGSVLRYVMYKQGVFMCQMAFSFCDGFVLVGLSYAMSRCKPLTKLSGSRPTSSLLGGATVASILSQLAIHVAFLNIALMLLENQTWYCPFMPEAVDLTKFWLLEDTHLSSLLFFVVAPQQMVGALCFSIGSEFRKSVWRNSFLMFYFAVLACFLVFLQLSPPNRVTEIFRVDSSTNVIGLPDIPSPLDFRRQLLYLALTNGVVAMAFEFVIILGPVHHFMRKRWHHDSLNIKL
ncbi:TPA: hypothetical protein N0F65_004001 [Lagenidium giganteum]|uniref:P-type ATPase A domain-containing protein n=1 Tax=Lagenidium giganteum TaxID=4803 RepID=A0AAV2YXP4_9STRA|nr:TPA: hypothetical protein N0F65_004001 [Lagenidium giganteum]